MPSADDLHGQLQLVCQYFHSRIGLPLLRYETAMFLDADSQYRAWPGRGIWLYFASVAPVEVLWELNDQLRLDCEEPFPACDESANLDFGSVINALPELNLLCGGILRAAYLDATDDHWDGATLVLRRARLLLQFDRGWLEVFNAMDENGYAVHAARPDGEWVRCA